MKIKKVYLGRKQIYPDRDTEVITLQITDRTSSRKIKPLNLTSRPKRITWTYTARHDSGYSDLFGGVANGTSASNSCAMFDHADGSNYSYYGTRRNDLYVGSPDNLQQLVCNNLYQATGTWETTVSIDETKGTVKNATLETEGNLDTTGKPIITSLFNDYTNIGFLYKGNYSNFTSDVVVTIEY